MGRRGLGGSFSFGLLVVACAGGAFVACSGDDDATPGGGDAGQETTTPETSSPDAPGGDTGADANVEPPFDCTQESSAELPEHLRCTGLYETWSKKTVAAGVKEFAPAYTFWSDGATKKRWIYLPAGQKIDTTDMDAWVFPVGTKLWKEFVLDGKRVETRLFWKIASGTWARTTYQWSADESEAKRLDTGFTKNDPKDPNASGYEIPAVAKCDQCHNGNADKVLGFEAVSLGLPGATGYTLDMLVADGRLTTNPGGNAGVKPSIPDDGKGGKDALGWLHANCGLACHNQLPTANCAFRGMFVKLRYAEITTGLTIDKTDTYTTTVNVPSLLPGVGGYMRIAPGQVGTSAVHYLANRRDNTSPVAQMPPIASHKIDPTGVGYLATWIGALP